MNMQRKITPERINAQMAPLRPVRAWHQSARARHLIASCVMQPPVWEHRWIAPAGRVDRDEYTRVSDDFRVTELSEIRWASLDAIVSQGQTDKAKREYDRFARDTPYAVITAAQDAAAGLRRAAVTEMHLTAGGRNG